MNILLILGPDKIVSAQEEIEKQKKPEVTYLVKLFLY
jgi:hypothetical protein